MAERLDTKTLNQDIADAEKAVKDTAESFRDVRSGVSEMRRAVSQYNSIQRELNSAFAGLKSPILASIADFITSNNIAKQQIALKRKELSQIQASMTAKAAEIRQANALREAVQVKIADQKEENAKRQAQRNAELTQAQQLRDAQQSRIDFLTSQVELQEGVVGRSMVVGNTGPASGLRGRGGPQQASTIADREREQNRLAQLQRELAEATDQLSESSSALEEAQKTAAKAQEKDNAELSKLVAERDRHGTSIKRLTKEQDALQRDYESQQKELADLEFSKFADKLNNAARIFDIVGTELLELVAVIRKTQQTFGINTTQATRLRFDNLAESIDSYVSALLPGGRTGAPVSREEIEGAQAAFQAQFGGVISSEAAGRLATQAKEMGVTTEQLASARRAFMTSTMGDMSQAMSQQDSFIAEFEKKGLTSKDAMAAIEQNSELLARNGTRFAQSFARAAAEAKKIGVDLGKIDQVGDNIIGDFEGFLEKMSELGAMGFGFDSQRLAEIAESGDTGALMNELRSQLAATGKDITNLRRSEQLALSQAFGIPIAELQRMAGPGGKGKESTAGEQTVDEVKKSNGFLSRIAEAMGNAVGALDGLGVVLKGIGVSLGAYLAFRTYQRAKEGFKSTKEIIQEVVGSVKSNRPTNLPTGPLPEGVNRGTGTSMIEQAAPKDPNRLIKGAAAMLIMAGALYVFAKALQEFSSDKVDWNGVGIAMTSLTGLTAAIMILSKYMGSGDIIKGTIGMGIMSVALGIMAKALQGFTDIKFSTLAIAGTALVGLGIAFQIVAPMMRALVDPYVIAGLAVLTLTMMGLGKALQYASPFVSAIGDVLSGLGDVLTGFAPVVDAVGKTIVGVFTQLASMSAAKLAILGISLYGITTAVATLGFIGIGASVGIGLMAYTIGKLAKNADKVQVLSSSLAQLKTTIQDLQTLDTTKLKEIGAAIPKKPIVATQTYTGATVAQTKETLPVKVQVDFSRLEAKLEQVVRTIGAMRVELDGTRVGRVITTTSTNVSQVGILGLNAPPV